MPGLIADFTTLGLGGPASRFATAATDEELVGLVREADAAAEPLLLIGGGSNLVVADAGWPGLVVLIRTDGIVVEDAGEHVQVRVAAGVEWDRFVARSVVEGWSGLAAMSGIPGLAGATPVQNVGAYGSEVADVICSLTVLDRRDAQVSRWGPQQCGFGFRTSAFKHTDRYVIVDVTFALRRSREGAPVRYLDLARRLGIAPGGVATSERIREVVLELRRSKGMLLDPDDPDTRSVGSFFVNPFVAEDKVPPGCPHWQVDGGIKLSAAWLIENAGFGKGFGLDTGRGRVCVSTKHALALTNRGGASTAELLELAREIRAGVLDAFGVRLQAEAHLVGVEL